MSAGGRVINWFELPMMDEERAKKFYENVFGIEMSRVEAPDAVMLFFRRSGDDPGVTGGALVRSEYHRPGLQGGIVYLNATPSIDATLDKIVAEGGQVLFPKTQISPELGYSAIFMDSEGNKVGLHGMV